MGKIVLKNYTIILIICIVLILTGCLSNPVLPDHSCDETTAIELRDVDYLLLANTMVDELTASNAVIKLAENKRLNVYVDKLFNDTAEAINIEQVEMAINNRLMRSAKINLQQDPAKADFIVTGGFSEKFVDCNEPIDQFSLILKSTRSNQIIWTQNKTNTY